MKVASLLLRDVRPWSSCQKSENAYQNELWIMNGRWLNLSIEGESCKEWRGLHLNKEDTVDDEKWLIFRAVE